MTTGEQLYLALVLATFCGFGSWLFYVTSRYDRRRAGRPEARRYEAPPELAHDMAHAGAD